ncbi:hypothetical protein Csa_003311 [Cucumis sativus]|uniref:Uncharacterized protein n=1 Tax=Cucumis sativus TaxID=3659 RepID=A0A0A0KKV0_CUCSA|nr:hypothetical protein Csa_003311 [Cucumis sativus]
MKEGRNEEEANPPKKVGLGERRVSVVDLGELKDENKRKRKEEKWGFINREREGGGKEGKCKCKCKCEGNEKFGEGIISTTRKDRVTWLTAFPSPILPFFFLSFSSFFISFISTVRSFIFGFGSASASASASDS